MNEFVSGPVPERQTWMCTVRAHLAHRTCALCTKWSDSAHPCSDTRCAPKDMHTAPCAHRLHSWCAFCTPGVCAHGAGVCAHLCSANRVCAHLCAKKCTPEVQPAHLGVRSLKKSTGKGWRPHGPFYATPGAPPPRGVILCPGPGVSR
jgi:hypothetical protein